MYVSTGQTLERIAVKGWEKINFLTSKYDFIHIIHSDITAWVWALIVKLILVLRHGLNLSKTLMIN
jgi:hypothetical protein